MIDSYSHGPLRITGDNASDWTWLCTDCGDHGSARWGESLGVFDAHLKSCPGTPEGDEAAERIARAKRLDDAEGVPPAFH